MSKGSNMDEAILILADDLTGAGDTGVQFVKADLPARIRLKWTRETELGPPEDGGVLVINTETRAPGHPSRARSCRR